MCLQQGSVRLHASYAKCGGVFGKHCLATCPDIAAERCLHAQASMLNYTQRWNHGCALSLCHSGCSRCSQTCCRGRSQTHWIAALACCVYLQLCGLQDINSNIATVTYINGLLSLLVYLHDAFDSNELSLQTEVVSKIGSDTCVLQWLMCNPFCYAVEG